MTSINNNKVLCFGEALLRIQSSTEHFYEPSNTLKLYPGGSEANVAVSLAHMGISTSYFTAGPSNKIFKDFVKALSSIGLDTSKIRFEGDRIGSYYLYSANGLTQGDVVYDRQYSSFTELNTSTINYDILLENIDWLHFTAITPALNSNLAIICNDLLLAASNKGITISVDLNYRSKLWQYGKSPQEVMPELVKYADLIMGNIWAANKMLGTSINTSLNRHSSVEEYENAANTTTQEIFDNYPKCKHVAHTFRFMDNATHNLFYATYHTRNSNYISTIHETNEVVDRIGSGDAFMAGLVRSIILKETPQQVIEIATNAGFQKLFVEGDFGNGKF